MNSVLIVMAVICLSVQTFATPAPTTPPAPGPGMSGGGYIDQDSRQPLLTAAHQLAQDIRQASPQIFSHVSHLMSQEQMASIIEHVRPRPGSNVEREGRHLMFNYGRDAHGPYIEALEPYFFAYEALIGAWSPEIEARLRLKLVHETAHLLGYDETRAYEFAQKLIHAIQSDVIRCETDVVRHQYDRTGVFRRHVNPPFDPTNPFQLEMIPLASYTPSPNPWMSDEVYVFVIHRLSRAVLSDWTSPDERHQGSAFHSPSFLNSIALLRTSNILGEADLARLVQLAQAPNVDLFINERIWHEPTSPRSADELVLRDDTSPDAARNPNVPVDILNLNLESENIHGTLVRAGRRLNSAAQHLNGDSNATVPVPLHCIEYLEVLEP